MRPLDLPPGWASGVELTPQTIGESGAWVYRAGPDHFIKSEPISWLAELPGEIARLRWLNATGLPCPAVVDATDHGGRHWLLMTALPGHDLASTELVTADTAVRLMAEALRRLHALDVASCPFDHRAAIRVTAASARYEAGLYDGDDPEQGPADYARLIAGVPTSEDLVVTHGDACFPNFMTEGGRFTGYIDCGRLGTPTATRTWRWPAAASSATTAPRRYRRFLRLTGSANRTRRNSTGTRCWTSFSSGSGRWGTTCPLTAVIPAQAGT